MGHFELVTTLLAAMVLMDVFQVMWEWETRAHWDGSPVTPREESLWTERIQDQQSNLLEAAFPPFCRLHMVRVES